MTRELKDNEKSLNEAKAVKTDKSPEGAAPSDRRRLSALMSRTVGRFGISFQERIDMLIRVILTAAIAWGCFLVVSPFLTAILLSAVIAAATWPAFDKLRIICCGRTTPAAALMVLGIVIIFLIPFSFILIAVAQQVPRVVALAGEAIKDPTPMLEAVRSIPHAGAWLYEQLLLAFDPAAFGKTTQRLIEPLSSGVLNAALNVSHGLIQLALVALIVFFFYRDGVWLAERVRALLERVSGGISHEICGILVNTTRSVVFGIVGTAICQGLVAGIGFWIAGVPGVLILSATVCLLSVIPIGPPLVWIPAAVWLYTQGSIGMAVFMALWGALAVSSVDNFVKPLLIARGSPLPIALIFLGVFGGALAFGFLGLILGPLLLAIGLSLLRVWLKRPVIGASSEARTEEEAG